MENTCIYCGSTNESGRETCAVCGQALNTETDAGGGDEFLPISHPPDVGHIDLRCSFENGFAYPDWRALGPEVARAFPEALWEEVYRELSKRWLQELKANLGGTYRCYESENFLLLAAEGKAPCRKVLSQAEAALAAIGELLGPLTDHEGYGKRVLLAFSEQDDYYAYLSHFHPDGEHSLSMGVFLSGGGYMHIAFPFTFVFASRQVIIHELAHNCIGHLPVPTWIHEGLAQQIEQRTGVHRFVLDRELAERHYGHWNDQNIQAFWSGASFYGPDDGNELSYSLAEILVTNLSKDWSRFLEFVQEADYADGGQDASLRVLDRCLGEVLGEFLGTGQWRPQRKVIADHHRRRA